jgi:ABC-type uncharacterized transport system permease subunit
MEDLATTIVLAAMTVLSLAAWIIMIARLGRGEGDRPLRKSQYSLVGVITVTAIALIVYRMAFVYQSWQPLRAHVDGLLLIAALLSMAVLFLQTGRRMPEFSGFALPVLTLLLAWAICASRFTLELFAIDDVWRVFHLASVYLGTISVAVGAVAGTMYLYVQRRLRQRGQQLPRPGRFASLESLERVIARGAALGFALITLGLASGLIIEMHKPDVLGPGWWYSPKVLLATFAWLVFAVLMNVRHATRFRGARAAWLSIFGLVLLLATMGFSL